jgi:hypothetical protein
MAMKERRADLDEKDSVLTIVSKEDRQSDLEGN